MEFLNFLTVSVIIALGISGGYLAGRIAEEELKPGEKYFQLLGKILLGLVLAAFLYSMNINRIALVIILIITAVFTAYSKIKNINIPLYAVRWVYAGLGILFALTPEEFSAMTGALILMYGFPAGTLIYFKRQTRWQAVLPILAFVIAANLAYIAA